MDLFLKLYEVAHGVGHRAAYLLVYWSGEFRRHHLLVFRCRQRAFAACHRLDVGFQRVLDHISSNLACSRLISTVKILSQFTDRFKLSAKSCLTINHSTIEGYLV